MSESSSFIIRRMTGNDLKQALQLSVAEGWNQTMNDWMFLQKNPDNLCIVAEKDGIIAGTATALNYSGKVIWIGMVLVSKSLRGMGAGRMLMSELIRKTGKNKCVKLDATPAGYSLYKSLGFIDEYRILRMTINSLQSSEKFIPDNSVSALSIESLPQITDKDADIFGVRRDILINYLFEEYPDKAYFLSGKKNDWGFLLGRNGSRYNYIGPLYTHSADNAKSLIREALQNYKGKAVVLDVQSDKNELIVWLESTGFVVQREFVRMYLINNPYPGKPEFQFLISGPESG